MTIFKLRKIIISRRGKSQPDEKTNRSWNRRWRWCPMRRGGPWVRWHLLRELSRKPRAYQRALSVRFSASPRRQRRSRFMVLYFLSFYFFFQIDDIAEIKIEPKKQQLVQKSAPNDWRFWSRSCAILTRRECRMESRWSRRSSLKGWTITAATAGPIIPKLRTSLDR